MNYLDYETTRLLPENPYDNERNLWWISADYLGEEEPILTASGSIAYDADGMLAWSFEDVRLYLRDKGYEFYVTTARFKNDSSKTEYKAVIDIFFESGYSFEDEIVLDNEYYSFEECRLAAIQYCLNLINNDNRTINTE